MKSRPGIIVIAVVSVALAACSVAPAAKLATASKAPAAAPAPVAPEPAATPFDYTSLYGSYYVETPAASPTPGEDVQSLHWTYMKRGATDASSKSTPGSGSSLTSRPDGRAPAAAISAPSGEDFQSLHATYNHLAR
jgi:hypothetical protein